MLILYTNYVQITELVIYLPQPFDTMNIYLIPIDSFLTFCMTHAWYPVIWCIWYVLFVVGQDDSDQLPCNMYSDNEMAATNLLHALLGSKINFWCTCGAWILGVCTYWLAGEYYKVSVFVIFLASLKILTTPPVVYDTDN